jgi:plasmid maintenance system antidote protein VapI
LGWTRAKLNELIKGKRGITAETALDLVEALKTLPRLWMNLQATYDLARASAKRDAAWNQMKELEVVVLTRDLPREGLQAGDLGTIVLVHAAGAGYEVEFTTLAGDTIAVVAVEAGSIRPVARGEIAHVRKVA